MNKKEFIQYIQELEHFYGQELNDTEREIWFNNLKFMTVERFNYIIAEIYKVNKFMPKLAEILEMHRSIPYVENIQKDVKGYCEKCDDTGYVTYTKLVNNRPYMFMAVCDCGRHSRYDGTKINDERHRSEYYMPTASETGLEIKGNKPTKKQVYDSMMKLKNSSIVPESIKEIIRKEFVKMEG